MNNPHRRHFLGRSLGAAQARLLQWLDARANPAGTATTAA